jgi:hypothetical protein
MKTILYLSFLSIAFILFTGCAATSIISYTDPDYRAVQFKKILVVANTNKLGDRLNLENRMVEVLDTNGIKAITSYSIFPPTREFTDSLKEDLMIGNKIDGCLMIYFGEKGIEQVQIPIIGSKTKGTVTNNSRGADYESQTTYIGGQILDKPYAEFEIKLFDVINGRMAWIASSFTGGNAYANFNTVYNSFCDKIVDKLSQDNLIRTLNDIARMNKVEIDRIIKERENNLGQNKIDLVVLNHGTIIIGKISRIYKDNYSHENCVEMQDKDQDIQKIKIIDIKEVYQKLP